MRMREREGGREAKHMVDRGASQINQTTPPNLLAHIRARHACIRIGAGVRGGFYSIPPVLGIPPLLGKIDLASFITLL